MRGPTCRCNLCGHKSAGGNNVRREYLALGIRYSEDPLAWQGKRALRKRARAVAKRTWRKELEVN